MVSEFMQLEKEERAQIISEMVETIAIETELPIDICVAIVAEYKNYSIRRIERYIKIVDPILLYQVAFYHNNKRIYKQQVDNEIKECLVNKLTDVIASNPFEVDVVWLRKVIQEYVYRLKE